MSATTPPPTIEVFAEVACPFAHVSLRRLLARRDEVGGPPLHVRAWPLEVVNGRPVSARHVAHEVDVLRAGVAPDLFAGFDAARFPASSMPALGLTAVAYQRDATTGEAVAFDLRRTLFDEGLDVADPEVLAAVAARHGLAWSPGDGADVVLADHEEGRARGVQGSPHFFAGELDAFCPSLRITRPGGELHVEFDQERFDAFTRAALGSPAG